MRGLNHNALIGHKIYIEVSIRHVIRVLFTWPREESLYLRRRTSWCFSSRNQSARVHFLDSTPCGEYCKFCHYSILYLGLNGNGYTYNPSRVNIIQSPLLSPFVFLVNSILGIFLDRKDVRFVTEDQISIKECSPKLPKNDSFPHWSLNLSKITPHTYQLHMEICLDKYHNTIRSCFDHWNCLIFHSNLFFEIQLFWGHG